MTRAQVLQRSNVSSCPRYSVALPDPESLSALPPPSNYTRGHETEPLVLSCSGESGAVCRIRPSVINNVLYSDESPLSRPRVGSAFKFVRLTASLGGCGGLQTSPRAPCHQTRRRRPLSRGYCVSIASP